MIDRHEFSKAWALLCERFGKQTSDILFVAYYDALTDRMSTEEFRAAAQRVFEEREFFPRPVDFLQAGRDTRAEALAQWELAQSVIAGNRGYEVLNAEARRVLLMLGGASELGRANLDQVPFIRREFFQLYGDAADIARREAGVLAAPNARQLTVG